MKENKKDVKAMYTLSDMAKALNRSPVYLHGLQARFDLPTFKGAGYSAPYLAFLCAVVYLRVLNVSEELLRELWCLEKKLLQLLHMNSAGSKTWFLDSCGQTTHSRRRLLLSNSDLGVELPSRSLQPALNFATKETELFAGREMGENALRVLEKYLKLYNRIKADLTSEVLLVRSAARWAVRTK